MWSDVDKSFDGDFSHQRGRRCPPNPLSHEFKGGARVDIQKLQTKATPLGPDTILLGGLGEERICKLSQPSH